MAGLGLGTAALIGCGGDDDDGGETPTGPTATAVPQATATPVPETIKKGGTFTAHMGGSPRSLDPHFDTFAYNTFITANTNNGLLQFTPDLTEIIPDLAEGLPEQPDELTFVFKIKQGVKWQNIDPVNGREFTAEDVVYAINRQRTDEAGKYQHAYFFRDSVTSIDPVDDYTVRFTMAQPFAPFLSYVASPWTLMANREAVEKFGDLTEQAVGTGPFIFEEWQKDVGFKLRANPDYFEPGLPHIDRFEILLATNPDTTATLFIDKKVDAVMVARSQLQRTQQGRPDANYAPQPSQYWREMRMQPTTPDNPYEAPFKDIRVRRAIVQAIDAQQVLDFAYDGDGVLTNGPILPIYETWALKDPVPEQGYDLTAARALMEQAGNPTISGPMIWAANTVSDQIGEILKQQLSAIGVNVELTPMELAAYYNQTYSYDYFMSHHQPLNNPDPDENLSSYFGRNATFFKHHNEDIWAKIDQQAVELDFEKRKALVEEAQKMVVLDFPVKFMFTHNLHQFTDPRVQNWFYGGDLSNGRLRGLWLDG